MDKSLKKVTFSILTGLLCGAFLLVYFYRINLPKTIYTVSKNKISKGALYHWDIRKEKTRSSIFLPLPFGKYTLNIKCKGCRGYLEVEGERFNVKKTTLNILFPRPLTAKFKILLPREVVKINITADRLEKIQRIEIKRKGSFPYFLIFLVLLTAWICWTVLEFVEGKRKYFFYTLLFLTILAILDYTWLNDDIYVTFRHVKNFLAGQGIGYNPGERVEGFSHPLWFFLLSLFHFIGLPLKTSAILLSYLFLFLTLWVLKKSGILETFVPLFFTTWGAIIFTTSGFETPLSFFLLGLSLYLLLFQHSKPLLTGVVLGLMGVNRPDFLVYVLVFSIAGFKNRGRGFLKILFPAGGILLLTEILRMGYFAELLPNSAMAKLLVPTDFNLGLRYLWDFAKSSNLVLIVFLIVLWAFRRRTLSMVLSLSMAAFLHLFMVVERGGGYMHARLLLPDYFILAFLTAIILKESEFIKQQWKTAVILIAAFFPVFSHMTIPHWNTSRDSYYPFNKSGLYYENLFTDYVEHPWYNFGLNLRRFSEALGRKIRVEIQGTGMTGFAAGEKVYIIDYYGLTDPVVARVKVHKRSRPGHEKYLPLPYRLMRELDLLSTPAFKEWIDLSRTELGYAFMIGQEKDVPYIGKRMDEIKRKLFERLNSLNPGALSMQDQERIWVFIKTFQGSMEARELQRKFAVKDPFSSWKRKYSKRIKLIFERKRVKLTLAEFIKNIYYSLKFFHYRFD